MAVKYLEENGRYTIDCTAAMWSTDKLHDYYQDSAHRYGDIGFLCDVDVIIENEDTILLVEYKNATISGAAFPERFKPEHPQKLDNVAKKYFDSLHYLNLMGKDKPKKYIYILEYPSGDSVSRRMIRNKLKERLPFALQRHLSMNGRTLIDEIKVMTIDEWNADIVLGAYPIEPVPTLEE